MILNHLSISTYSGVLKFDMNVTRLEIGRLFTQGTRRGHPFTLDIFLVLSKTHKKFKLISKFHKFSGQYIQTASVTVASILNLNVIDTLETTLFYNVTKG